MTTTFEALGVDERMVHALSERGITAPFAIQGLTIADALAGRDVCGKAKTGYATDDAAHLISHYRDDGPAFDGAKLAKLEGKGETNNRINAYVMGKLAAAGVPTHFVRLIDDRESLVRTMKMIPVECVVRNVCAGSMAKRYGVAEGLRLPAPVFEFFYKSDALHDPLCNDDHTRALGWPTDRELGEMQALPPPVNLSPIHI